LKTVTAKALINQTKTKTVTAKGDITGEGITPVTRTKTIAAKGLIPVPGTGILVSKPTYSVLTEPHVENYIFDSAYGTLKYNTSGSVNITIYDGDTMGSAEYIHNLGYIPFVEVYVHEPYGDGYETCPTSYPDEITGYTISYTVTTTKINFYAIMFNWTGEATYALKFFIFSNDLDFDTREINLYEETTTTDVVTI
jgi:hypothetical protein